MKRHQRNLLAVALTAALASPLAFAQGVTGQVTGTVQGTTELPTRVVERTTDTATEAAQDTTSTVDRTAQDTEANVAADAQVTGQTKVEQEEDTPRQGFAPPAIWATLDANADGHIDAGEASADADFQQDFDAIDTNNDGVVNKAEFRVESSDDADDADDADDRQY